MTNALSETDADRVLEILSRELDVKKEQLSPGAKLQQDLGADSLTVIQLLMALEEDLHITIPDENWDHDLTVAEVMHQVRLFQARREP